MRGKRDIATLARLLKKCGDVSLSEAIARLGDSRPGAPRRWGVNELVDVFGGVEIIMARCGSKITEACRLYARFSGHAEKVIQKRHAEAWKRFGELATPEFFDGYLQRRPEFRNFLLAKERCSKTPPIQ